MRSKVQCMQHIVNWFEIPVVDLDRAAVLYGAVLGGPLPRQTFMGVPHAMIPAGSAPRGALIVDPARPPRAGSTTVIYLDASSGIDAMLARATDAGATIVQPKTSIGPQGHVALFEDLDGNVVGLHEPLKA